MATWQTPITDRTQNDVDDVKRTFSKPFSEWTEAEIRTYATLGKVSKGSLSRNDIMRVESNMQVLSDVFSLDFNMKETWNYYTYSTADNQREFDCLTAIYGACDGFNTTPEVPEMPWNTWQKWNDVEQILLDIYTIVQSNFDYLSLDNIRMGEDVGLLL